MGRWRYGVILDAGSSGTRIHVYRWLDSEIAKEEASEDAKLRLPVLETDKHWTLKIHPGISTFAANPLAVGPEHLASLYAHALDIVPPQDVPDTPLFLLATGGMRLLPEAEKAELLSQICKYSQEATKFELPDCELRIQVIPGDTEGLYGWIAANYLLGSFDYPEQHDHGKGHHTYGFLDMGGASAQIAFAPNVTETLQHSEDLKLIRLRTVLGTQKEYRVFSATWLKYGVNEARKRYIDALISRLGSGRQTELPDPCMPLGLFTTLEGAILDERPDDGIHPYLLGTGNFDECISRTLPLLDKDSWCNEPPCSVQGKHVPPMDFDVNHFVGVSEYWHTLYQLFERENSDMAYNYTAYRERITDFCTEPWMTLSAGVEDERWGDKIDEEFASEVCFKASWILNMLHEGIGIPRDFPILNNSSSADSASTGTGSLSGIVSTPKHGYLDPFQTANKIKDTEVSWTLGKMVLYAASQIPPLDSATLAVGFGSNRPGIPEDFQYASGLSEGINIAAPPLTYYPGRPNPDMDAAEDLNQPGEQGTVVVGTIDEFGNFIPDPNQPGVPFTTDQLLPPEPHPDFSHSNTGFVLIFIMLALIFVMLFGRERRITIRRKLASLCSERPGRGSNTTNGSRSKRRGALGKLLSILTGGRTSNDGNGAYERVESGLLMHEVDGSLYKTEDYEVDDDEDKGSKGLKENSGGMLTHGVGLGLGPVPAFEAPRLNLLDRERSSLAGESGRATGQRPSRNASPTRWRSPVGGSVKES